MGTTIYGEISDLIWSYTKLSSFEQCPYQFYLQYIEKRNGEGNFYADAGKAMHKTLELLEKGEVELSDSIMKFDDLWLEVDTGDTKKETAENWYWSCIDYLGSLTGFELDNYNVLEVEGKHRFTKDGNEFIGFIDLLLEDKATGDLIIVDHKSHNRLVGKNGRPLKSELKTLEGYKRQLYLYSYPVMQKYQKTPKNLAWNHFRTGDLTVVPFDWDEYREAWEWAESLIGKITEEKEFENKDEFFYCKNLCDFRHSCEYLEE